MKNKDIVDDEKSTLANEQKQDLSQDIQEAISTIAEDNSEDSQEKAKKNDAEDAANKKKDFISEVDHVMLELKDVKDKYLRLNAEFENYKKRSQREQVKSIKFANEKLLADFLPIVDNMERALTLTNNNDAQENKLVKEMQSGLNMVLKLFMDTLNKFDVKVITALNKPFDPNLHEAMQQVQNDQVEPGTVIQELQKGYILGDRLLRPSMVIVSKAAEE